MPQWKYRYETQEQLTKIFEFLVDSPLEINLSLSPAVPAEFFEAWGDIVRARISQVLPLPESPEKENISEAVQRYEAIARKEKIFPFVQCKFSDIHHFRPQVEMMFPLLPDISLYTFAQQPLLDLEGFLGRENWRYRKLYVESVNDPAQVRDIKEFIRKEVPQRYRIDGFFLKLNAKYSTSDHYYERESNEGVLYLDLGGLIVLEYTKKEPAEKHLARFLPEIGVKLQE